MSDPTFYHLGPVDWNAVRQAQSMTPMDRLLDGAELFDLACSTTLAGIRNQNPGISDSEALQRLRERIELVRRMETFR